jgi:hypothetical protein
VSGYRVWRDKSCEAQEEGGEEKYPSINLSINHQSGLWFIFDEV